MDRGLTLTLTPTLTLTLTLTPLPIPSPSPSPAGEMERGLASTGFVPPPGLIRALFDELDANGSYKLGFEELQGWMYSADDPEAQYTANSMPT